MNKIGGEVTKNGCPIWLVRSVGVLIWTKCGPFWLGGVPPGFTPLDVGGTQNIGSGVLLLVALMLTLIGSWSFWLSMSCIKKKGVLGMRHEKRCLTASERSMVDSDFDNAIPSEKIHPDQIFKSEDGTRKAFRLFRPGEFLFHVHEGVEEWGADS